MYIWEISIGIVLVSAALFCIVIDGDVEIKSRIRRWYKGVQNRVCSLKGVIAGLVVLTLISIYIILYVGLGYGWPLGSSENADRINNVALNISYSYIAGLIFYFFTSYLPYLVNKKKIKTILIAKSALITQKFEACVKSCLINYNDPISYDGLTAAMANRSVAEISSLGKLLNTNTSIIQDWSGQIHEMEEVCNQLLEYRKYLSTDQIEGIEKLKNTDFKRLIYALKNPLLQNPQFEVTHNTLDLLWNEYQNSIALNSSIKG